MFLKVLLSFSGKGFLNGRTSIRLFTVLFFFFPMGLTQAQISKRRGIRKTLKTKCKVPDIGEPYVVHHVSVPGINTIYLLSHVVLLTVLFLL
jgi:hypothetical protein